MTRRTTLGERRWPTTREFVAVARAWATDAIERMLGFVWGGFDLLRDEVLRGVNVTNTDDEVERSITQYLAPRIHRLMDGDEPFYVLHGPYEYETRMAAPAQSPQYDVAFVLTMNDRVMWPLEAKVLRTDKTVAEYVNDLRDQFLTCRYAPFSREGAMLGYLLTGDPEHVFRNIGRAIPCRLRQHPAFRGRAHKTSSHRRVVPQGKPYPRAFRCHHLILAIGS